MWLSKTLWLVAFVLLLLSYSCSNSSTTTATSLSFGPLTISDGQLNGRVRVYLQGSSQATDPIIPGTFDSSFASQGENVVDFEVPTTPAAMARQSNGRILVLNTFRNEELACDGINFTPFTPEGELEPSFHNGEVAGFIFPGYNFEAVAIAIQPDDKILVLANFNSQSAALFRFTSDGAIDTSFAEDGLLILGNPDISLRAASVALQNNGNILVLFTERDPLAPYSFYNLIELNPEGGPTGMETHLGEDNTDLVAHQVMVQPDSKILLLGSATTPGQLGFSIHRLLVDGNPDPSFVGGVYTDRSQPWVFLQGSSLALQEDGKILIGGFLIDTQKSMNGGLISRQLASGPSDDPFGTPPGSTDGLGAIGLFYQNSNTYVTGLQLQEDQKILALARGTDENSGKEVTLLYRQQSDGVSDSFFGENGVSPLKDEANDLFPVGITLDDEKKVLIAARSPNNLLVLARFQTQGLQSLTLQKDNYPVINATLHPDGTWSVPLSQLKPGYYSLSALYEDGSSSVTSHDWMFCEGFGLSVSRCQL